MKKHILGLSLAIALSLATQFAFAQDSLIFTTRSSDDHPVAFRYASVDSAADFQHFRKYAEANIGNNARIIDQLKVRKTKGDNEVKAKFRNEVSELETKNEEMAMRIAIADLMATSNWPSFKRDFTKEMTELTTSIRNLADQYFINN